MMTFPVFILCVERQHVYISTRQDLVFAQQAENAGHAAHGACLHSLSAVSYKRVIIELG
jgi:hypothetical protein